MLTSISGATYEEAAAGAIAVVNRGVRYRVAGRAGLRANKRASGRDEDLRDLAALEQVDSD